MKQMCSAVHTRINTGNLFRFRVTCLGCALEDCLLNTQSSGETPGLLGSFTYGRHSYDGNQEWKGSAKRSEKVRMKGQRRKRSQERDPGSQEPGTSTKGASSGERMLLRGQGRWMNPAQCWAPSRCSVKFSSISLTQPFLHSLFYF